MRKLNLHEMWRLYLILQPYLPEKRNEFLVDEMEAVFGKMQWPDLKRSLEILYKKIPDDNPIVYLLMMIRGLKENNFFVFVDFIDKLK